MSILTVERVFFSIHEKKFDAYTGWELYPDSDQIIYYLSGRGLASSINLDESTTRLNRLPKELKGLLGEDFATRHGTYKNTEGGKSRINLWGTWSAAQYYVYHAERGNEEAKLIVRSLVATSLDLLINDAFGQEYKRGQAQEWVNARMQGKQARRTFTDAASDYVKRHPDRSEGFKKFAYSNATDRLYRGLFGKSAKQLKEERKCHPDTSAREFLNESELKVIEYHEHYAAKLVDKQDFEPDAAIIEAMEFYS